jgi:hypothetical protein
MPVLPMPASGGACEDRLGGSRRATANGSVPVVSPLRKPRRSCLVCCSQQRLRVSGAAGRAGRAGSSRSRFIGPHRLARTLCSTRTRTPHAPPTTAQPPTPGRRQRAAAGIRLSPYPTFPGPHGRPRRRCWRAPASKRGGRGPNPHAHGAKPGRRPAPRAAARSEAVRPVRGVSVARPAAAGRAAGGGRLAADPERRRKGRGRRGVHMGVRQRRAGSVSVRVREGERM